MENVDKALFLKIINNIVAKETLSVKEVQQLLFDSPKSNGAIPRKSHVIEAYKILKKDGLISLTPYQEDHFLQVIRMKRTRTLSGVTPVTVLTKPYPCPGECIFCPNDYRMPKSYLRDEPGAQRAEANKFDPYLQTYNRLVAYTDIGHPTDKVELIVLGGTWSFYPKEYQRWFIKRCLDAMNDFEYRDFPDALDTNIPLPYDESLAKEVYANYHKYNIGIAKALDKEESRNEDTTWDELISSQRTNETASSRCVGMVVETRPDHVTEEELEHIRRLGVTKLQIGLQSLNDSVLEKNKRGHTVDEAGSALSLIRQAGFKIHAHWMPNLYGSTPEEDITDYKRLFTDNRFMPDELKIYPCSLIESAELMKYYKEGLWKPYIQEELLSVLESVMVDTPRYCRITRMIRDISSNDIVTGNKKTNFRQLVDAALKTEGKVSKEIRSREIRNRTVELDELSLRESTYVTSVSREIFLEYVTREDLIAGFLRLSLPTTESFLEELFESAIIREVHVYGQSVRFGVEKKGNAQHAGLGKSLMIRAKEIALDAGFANIAVISSIGTREYYRKNGFRDGTLYQHLSLIS